MCVATARRSARRVIRSSPGWRGIRIGGRVLPRGSIPGPLVSLSFFRDLALGCWTYISLAEGRVYAFYVLEQRLVRFRCEPRGVWSICIGRWSSARVILPFVFLYADGYYPFSFWS